jgi:hypothetical protein
MLLRSERFSRRVAGVVLAASCSASALYGVEFLQRGGLDVWAVSGLITNSPLYVKEFSARSAAPAASSWGKGQRLAKILMKQFARGTAADSRPEAAALVE